MPSLANINTVMEQAVQQTHKLFKGMALDNEVETVTTQSDSETAAPLAAGQALNHLKQALDYYQQAEPHSL